MAEEKGKSVKVLQKTNIKKLIMEKDGKVLGRFGKS